MPITKIGVNLTGLENIGVPSFDLKNTSEEIINDIPIKANELTGGFYGLIVLVTLFIFLLWKLNQEQSEGGDFGYSATRSMGIAGSICGIIGIYAINMGFFVNFFHVVIFIIIAFLSTAYVYKSSS